MSTRKSALLEFFLGRTTFCEWFCTFPCHWLTALSLQVITELSGPRCKSSALPSINANTQTQRLLLEVIRSAAWSDNRSTAWSIWIHSSSGDYPKWVKWGEGYKQAFFNQADRNAIVYLCRAWLTETLELQQNGRGRGQRESSCLTVIILSKVGGVLALQQFHWGKSEASHSPLYRAEDSDTHTIPFDKLRPVGNKVAVVCTAVWVLVTSRCTQAHSRNSFGVLTSTPPPPARDYNQHESRSSPDLPELHFIIYHFNKLTSAPCRGTRVLGSRCLTLLAARC